ncbi:PucR family transcriptional regulator [Bacillus sp. DJP31]|uniref:PucR family transcriptional regulator n=1 Tax=Bacillus sp. DJP31 TaxID=3409789 RepID=UPI003BB758C4
MIDKLRKQYPSLVVEESLPKDSTMQYYRLDSGSYIGIHKGELSQKDRNLLSVFLAPISIENSLSTEQSLWKQAILSKEKKDLCNHYEENTSFRLIHFFLQNDVDVKSFEEAISSLSFTNKVVVWITPQNGIIVEQPKHEWVPKEELMDLRSAIATDFYTDMYFYIGEFFSLQQPIHELYEWETQCFNLSRVQFKNKGVFQFFETIPYILLKDTNEETRKRISHLVYDFTKEELHSIKVFIESGLNISFAAKKLFMHRNSLQYRVDKFTEKTGIDVKSFQGALVVYLAILSENF